MYQTGRLASDQRTTTPATRPAAGDPRRGIVIATSGWVKSTYPATGANPWDATHTGKDRRRDPEPDLEAEP
jgi:hypothetical protein